MFSNVIILVAVVVTVSCYDHQVYTYKNAVQHPHKEHHKRQHYHHIRVQPEPSSSEEYSHPEPQQYQIQESHESNENIVPVYHQVEEQNQHDQGYAQHEAVKQKYETVQYPVPAHHEYQTLSHQADSQEEIAYHHPTAHHSAPIQHAPIQHEAESHHSHDSHDEPIDYYAYPKYQYEYKVEDPHTGDNKFQHEYRDGDVVKGVYGLHEADGSIRTVEYSSDKHHGFTAVVKHSAPGQHVHIESHHKN